MTADDKPSGGAVSATKFKFGDLVDMRQPAMGGDDWIRCTVISVVTVGVARLTVRLADGSVVTRRCRTGQVDNFYHVSANDIDDEGEVP